MFKNGLSLISRQSSNFSLLNRVLCRNFITLSRYNNFRVLNNNRLPIQMSLNFIQSQNMCTRDNNNSDNLSSNSGKEIFVANLPWRADNNALGDFFSKYGDVEDAKVVMDPEGKSKGFGFVKFYSAEDCERALSEAENMNMGGRQISVRIKTSAPRRDAAPRSERTFGNEKNSPTHTLFVGNISFNSTEESIREFFEEVAAVKDVRLAYSDTGKPKSFCHVEFTSVEEAQKALQSRDGQDLDGRNIRLDYAKTKN